MLEQVGTKVVYNNLSPELRKELDDKVAESGRFIKYKFAIARPNPDGERRAHGEYLYPLRWALTPVTYDIIDPYDQKRKRIGLINRLKEFGAPDDGFRRVHLEEVWQGVYRLDLENAEDKDVFAYLEMHPKLEGGKFRDKNMPALFSRIDEVKQAKKSLSDRENRANAMFVASTMSVNEVKDFACAMGWDEHQDIDIIRDKVLEIADKDSEFFKMPDPNVQYLKDSSKYVPQIASRDTHVILGDYTVDLYSGETSHRFRAEVLRRRSIMLDSVSEALKTANEAEAIKSEMTAKKLFGYLHNGTI